MHRDRYSRLTHYHRHIFYSVWMLLNLIQSGATELLDDEAYYWVYSQFIDWGYFDHPPMVALLIKAGTTILGGELGVRICFAVISTVTVWLLEKLLDQRDPLLYYTILLSLGVLQIGGIIAIPDTPLIFFTVVFFYFYRKLVLKPDYITAVLLGLSMALLLYSKYHGILVILFAVAANLKLFTRPHIYVAGITGILLFSPHLYWQFMNDFPSVQFHLRERNAPEYRISFTTDYIIGQIPLAGPLAAPILWWAAYKKKITGEFERALMYTLAGIYLFFLAFTLKGRIEANWTVPAFIPLIILSHQYLVDKVRQRKWLTNIAIATLILVFAVRIYTIVDLLPGIRFKEDEYHFNREWASAIRQQANGRPVFFTDSYQRAAKYWFYTGEETFSLNTVDYRRNNFNFWQMEEKLMGQRAYAIYQGKKQDYYHDSIATPKGYYLGREIGTYFSFSRIRIKPETKLIAQNGTVKTIIKVKADESMRRQIQPPYDSLRIMLTVYKKDSVIANIPTNLTINSISTEESRLPVSIQIPLPKGNYFCRFSIPSCIENWPTMNSSTLRLRVE